MPEPKTDAGWGFGSEAAIDQAWASPEFDYLQPYIGDLLHGRNHMQPAERESAAQQTRDARPFLIAHIRRFLGDPKWDPRGARVLTFPSGSDSHTPPPDSSGATR